MPEQSTQAYGRTDTLPPIGVTPGSPDARILRDLIYQRRLAIQQAFAKPLKLAALCRRLSAYGEDVVWPDDCKTVVHKIRQVVETQVANHLKEPVQVTIEPCQTGEYARWYWCGPQDIAGEIAQLGGPAGFQLDPLHLGATMPDGSTAPPLPLSLQMVAAYKGLSQQQPEIFDPEFICRLDDEYRAKAAQKMYDSDWREANNGTGGDLWLRYQVYSSTAEGWQLPLIERDPQTGNFLLGFNSVEQTYIAQESQIIALAPEMGIDLYLDLDECMAKYPQQAQAVVANQSWVNQQAMFAPNTQGQVPVQYRDQFRRPMVRKIIWWIRNQPMPQAMSEQEAVDGGHVQQNADQSQYAQDGPQISQQQPPSGQVGEQGIQPDVGNYGTPAGQAGIAADGATPDIGYASPFVLSTGQPVDPSHPDWPQKTVYVTRQVTIVSDEVVEDIALTAWPDPPLLHLRNSLVIGRAWSIGEPFYCRQLQEIITDVSTSARDHIKYNANPAQEMTGDLFDWMAKEYGEAFVTPGKILRVPPTTFKENPNGVVRTIEPPAFPESSLKILDVMNQALNDTAGRPDALAGNAPTPNASGQLVANLQAGAVEPLNFKAQDIAFAMQRLTRFFLHAEVNLTPLQKWTDITSIPLPLVSLVVDGLRARPPQVKITVSSGAGAVIDRKRANYVAWHNVRDPETNEPLISAQTTQEIIGADPAVEQRRNDEAKRRAMAMTAPQGPPPPSENISFKDLPPSGQVQMAAQAGLKLDPNELAQKQAQEHQQAMAKAQSNGQGGRFGANNNGNGEH